MTTHEATLPLPKLSLLERARRLRALQSQLSTQAQPVILLTLRLLFGAGLVVAGWGKVQNLDRITSFFTSLGIPFAGLNATFVSGLELVGGILLIAGLGSRLVSVPLLVTMAVAMGSAHAQELGALLSDPGTFISAAPVPFMVALLAIVGFGPGALSLDHWVAKRYLGDTEPSELDR